MEFLILDEGTGLTKAGVRFAERKTAADYIRQNRVSGVVVWPVGGTIFNVEMWAENKRLREKVRRQKNALRMLNEAHVNALHCLEVAQDRARWAASEMDEWKTVAEKYINDEEEHFELGVTYEGAEMVV